MTKTSSYPTTADAVSTYAGALEAYYLPKWTKGKSLETEVTVRNCNRIDVVVSPQENCTNEITVRLTYDSSWSLHPWTVEVNLPTRKGLDSLDLTNYTNLLREVGRLVEKMETLGNAKYRKV